MSPVWGISFWNGKFSFWCGALTIGVGRHVLVREIIIGVGRLFVMWETPLGVGILFLVWEIAIGVGNCDRSGASSNEVGRISWSPSAVLRET